VWSEFNSEERIHQGFYDKYNQTAQLASSLQLWMDWPQTIQPVRWRELPMTFDLFTSDLDATIQNNSKGLASLCKTRKIEESDLTDPIWRGLDAQYRRAKTPLALDFVSIANAIYHQKRMVFCFARSNAELVMRGAPESQKQLKPLKWKGTDL
jgi:hypothetical protein